MTPDKTIRRIETICAKREQCTFELRLKLRRSKFTNAEIDKIIADLVEKNFVNDLRFAKAFVSDSLRFSRWGERKIVAALKSKRIPDAYIREAMETISPEVVESNLLALLYNKAKTIPDAFTYEGRTKLFRYAVSRGYTPSLVSKVIQENFV